MRVRNLFLFMTLLGALSPIARGASEPSPLPFGMTKPTLDVGVVISDEAKAKNFYEGVLGLKPSMPFPLPGGAEMLRYSAGSTVVKLIHYPTNPTTYTGGITKGIGIRLLTLFYSDLGPVATAAVEHGLPKPAILGTEQSGRLIFINDPDGNQIELLEVKADRADAISDLFMIGLTVSDTDKSREFYGKTLGLEELEPRSLFPSGGPTKYSFKAGSTTIKFWRFDNKELPAHTGKPQDAVGLRYFTFMVKDVDAVYEEMKKRNVNVTMQPTNLGSVARIMFIEDPDGNTIEFAGRPNAAANH